MSAWLRQLRCRPSGELDCLLSRCCLPFRSNRCVPYRRDTLTNADLCIFSICDCRYAYACSLRFAIELVPWALVTRFAMSSTETWASSTEALSSRWGVTVTNMLIFWECSRGESMISDSVSPAYAWEYHQTWRHLLRLRSSRWHGVLHYISGSRVVVPSTTETYQRVPMLERAWSPTWHLSAFRGTTIKHETIIEGPYGREVAKSHKVSSNPYAITTRHRNKIRDPYVRRS